jgi:UDP-glucose 4-epimerase
MLVDECVEGMMYGFKHSRDRLNYFNLGAEDQTSVKRIVEILLEEAHMKRTKIKYTGGEGGWKGDVPVFLLSTKKMETLGWKPKHSSDDAVRAAAKITVREYLKKVPDSWLSVQKQ